MGYLRALLLPFSLLYGLAIWLRNRLYDWGWLRSTAFDQSVIVVGNLAVGGTGKSPMTEYLIRLLSNRSRVATLSRGYGRKTRGFLEVMPDDTAQRTGDEPLQFKRKFPEITVAVDEDRVHGVSRLIDSGHDTIVLDDAYQHRALRPGLAILLFDYHAMGKPKWLLPAGDYRDAFGERHRADVMVVTKTPIGTTNAKKNRIRQQLATTRDIPVLFASIGYGSLTPLWVVDDHADMLGSNVSVLLLTGIANPVPLYEYLSPQVAEIEHLRYADHHDYTVADIQKVVRCFGEMKNPNKLIVTTEKDAQRLLDPMVAVLLADLPIYMIPIHLTFDDADDAAFRKLVLAYCATP
ncbi:tetraacyldisaccharide 4'-kinase [Parapedobacter sp. 10938]|uniref:tetraacyldisaccharide 4'-kinase n=1 Tax=Parapedobacter flavus TaxID=3110225 RepID=UPI002DB78FCC|nr:tetraacyldisaccharide 4'-kinase [Parapedobacter sp. 10938]MEC3879950.1 tetraacyldisaccharide 4'-kinase [Parapedobacter sp. 10938]